MNCYRQYQRFVPAVVVIEEEDLCLTCVRSKGLDIDDGDLIEVESDGTDAPAAPKTTAPKNQSEEKMSIVKCGCGCGETVPPGSVARGWKFYRGHKPNEGAAASTSSNGGERKTPSTQVKVEPITATETVTMQIPASFVQNYWERLTLVERAALVNRHMLEVV